VATFHDLDEGVKLANESPYGLAHAVFSACPETRATVSRRVRAGVVWENCSQAVYPDTPFGGCKQSGFGREYGELGLEEYLHHKTVVTAVDGHMWRSFG
jgi:acyl-CoA reductase-like NAD-dependent aldehyde dehydrogenase